MLTCDTITEIQLMGNQVLIELEPQTMISRGGIHYPQTAARFGKDSHEAALGGKEHYGRVVACGPGARDKNGVIHRCEVAPGDRVQFYYFAEYDMLRVDARRVIVKESFIQCVFEED